MIEIERLILVVNNQSEIRMRSKERKKTVRDMLLLVRSDFSDCSNCNN